MKLIARLVKSNLVLKALGTGMLLHAGEPFVVHEWGTFTSVHASDRTMLSGLEREEHRLPNFVRSHSGLAPADKGWSRPVKNVTIKMETPVLYFYSDTEREVTVDVGFRGGSISQWYPERVDGERVTEPSQGEAASLEPWDFAKGYEGSIRWRATVLAPGTGETINNPRAWETPQWPRARVSGANLVKGPPGFVETGRADLLATAPVVEGFLFYRGIGNFDVPLHVTAAEDGSVTLRNTADAVIPYVLVYRKQNGGASETWECFELKPGEARVSPPPRVRKIRIHPALTDAGLTSAEAAAMLATWRESYFDAPGLRVFWIVPRTFTDRILPITVTPKPDKLERVLVGRGEVLTPEFERELAEEFRKNDGERWRDDRYFLAYRERARQLGVVLDRSSP